MTFATATAPSTATAPTSTGRSSGSAPGRADPRATVGAAAARNAVINVVLPTGVYYVAQPVLHSASLALAAAGAVPLARVVMALSRRQAVEPLAALSGAAYVVALSVYALVGSSLALELHDPIVIGGIGAALLVALAVGMSADGLVRRIAGDALPTGLGRVAPGEGRRTTVTMAIVAGTLVVHAAISVVIALSVPVANFQLDSTLAGIAASALGVLVAVSYRRRSAGAR